MVEAAKDWGCGAGLGAAALLVPSALTCLNPLGRASACPLELLLFLKHLLVPVCRAAGCEGALVLGWRCPLCENGVAAKGTQPMPPSCPAIAHVEHVVIPACAERAARAGSEVQPS